MQGAVKMPSAQVKINTAGRTQASQTSSTSDDFVKLLQVKGEGTKPSGQDKTAKDAKAENAANTAKETETPVKQPEAKTDTSAKNPSGETEEVDVEDAVQQAAAQQTAAWLAGIVAGNQETEPESAVPDESLSALAEISAEMVQTELPVQEENTAIQAEIPELPVQETTQPLQDNSQSAEAAQLPTQAISSPDQMQEAAKQPETAAVSSDLLRQVTKEEKQENPAAQTKTEEMQPDILQMRDVSSVQKPSEGQEAETHSEWGTAAKDAQKTAGISQEGENSQAQAAAGADTFRLFGQQEQHSMFTQRTENVPLRTTPDTLPQDLGKTIGANWSKGAGTLMVELEPASLGKLTIRLSYEGSRAAVSIMATNPKTLDMLNQKASEIAAILEEKTGQETVIYTEQAQTHQENYDRNPNSRGNQEEQEEKHQDKEDQQQFDSFAQQLRLGLV